MQVKREMLTLYQRISDSKINGTEISDCLNFQLVGNPGMYVFIITLKIR